MTGACARAALVERLLDEYVPQPGIPLAHHSPYTLLVATLLSAQCTDARVNQVTPRLWAAFGDRPSDLAEVPARQLEAIVRPCGLAPRKAQFIHDLSVILTERHGGQVPADFGALEALPGVGHKTASVVMSHAFGVPAFPVDTHIHRSALRWGLSDGTSVEKTEADLKKLYPPEKWLRLHLQIILFARSWCPARGHDPARCPICSVLPD